LPLLLPFVAALLLPLFASLPPPPLLPPFFVYLPPPLLLPPFFVYHLPALPLLPLFVVSPRRVESSSSASGWQ
jgi:hypothetical protein